MAKNEYTPTAANILSSLKVKGASVIGGEGKDSYIPVLDSRGLLDTSVIPLIDISANISISPLTKVAYVDKHINEDVTGYVPNGSIARPYRLIQDAADAGFTYLRLTPDEYSSVVLNFNSAESYSDIVISCDGTAIFDNITINGYREGTKITLENIEVRGTVLLGSSVQCSVVIKGTSIIGTIRGSISDSTDEVTSEWYLRELAIGPNARISNRVNVYSVVYIASGDRIENKSEVQGTTVTDAENRLHQRRIKLPKFSTDPSGIAVSDTEDVEVEEGLPSRYDIYDVSKFSDTLVKSVNDTFYKEGDSPDFSDIEANTVTTQDISTNEVSVEAQITLNDVPLRIDKEGFLVTGN